MSCLCFPIAQFESILPALAGGIVSFIALLAIAILVILIFLRYKHNSNREQ